MAAPSLAPLRSQPRRLPPAPARTLSLSIVIVNYCRWEETAALVEQLVGENALYPERLEIVVVDNASAPHPHAESLRRNPQVTLLPMRHNAGFAAGVNAGLRHCRGRWVLVLNPDLVVCDGFVDRICAAARELEQEGDERVGVVGFQLRNRDGTPQLSAGLFPTMGRMLLGLLRPRARRKYVDTSAACRRPVPWVTGSCLLVRRDCLEQLGGFDEEYFLYYEDVDLCRRARARGWSVLYEPNVQAVHLDPLQNRPLTAPLRAITRHASLTYFRKHLRGWQFWALAQLVRGEAWVRQWAAERRGRATEATICGQIRGICRELMRDRPHAARQRLDEVLVLAGMRT